MAVAIVMACYVDEPLEAPEAEPAEVVGSSAVEPVEGPPESAFNQGVSEMVQEVRQAEADAAAAEARRAALVAEAEALPPAERDERARELFMEGLRAFETGDYAAARDRFIESYVFAPDRHVLAFNIAKAAEKAGDCCTAREHYQRFLDHQLDGPDPGQVEQRLAELHCQCPGD